MTQENTTNAVADCSATGGFDALRILDDEFTITMGTKEYTFKTPKDEDGRIIAINGNGKNRPVTYSKDARVVIYDKNDGTGQAPSAHAFQLGQPVTLATLTHPRDLFKLDHTFDGWCTDPNGTGTLYDQGDSASFDANTILYAQFTNVFE